MIEIDLIIHTINETELIIDTSPQNKRPGAYLRQVDRIFSAETRRWRISVLRKIAPTCNLQLKLN